MNAIFKTFLLSLTIAAQVHFAYAQSVQGGIIPNGKATFLDKNGKPLTDGQVYFYTQNTTTPKTTYQDINLTTPNANPVILDAAGRALLWGNGVYRQQVFDRNNNLIWDTTTTSGGSGSTGPTATGDGDAVGSIKPWPGISPPNQYMFTYGQALSRSTFQPLFQAITSLQNVNCTLGSNTISGLSNTDSFWIGMTVEVACVPGGVSTITAKTSFSVTLTASANATELTGATFFMWGNGDGSTTFNLPDYRGVVPVGNNIMGGIAGTAINNTYYSTAGVNSAGALGGGNGSQTLTTTNLPPQTPHGTNASSAVNFSFIPSVVPNGTGFSTQLTSSAGGIFIYGSGSYAPLSATAAAQTFTGTAFTGQNSTPFSVVQPSKTINFVIKVTPDTAFSGTGVTSLGGMTGDIICGSGINCSGNTISSTAAVTAPTPTVLGGVFSLSCSNAWFSSLDLTGAFTCTTPSFGQITGLLPNSQLAVVGAATLKGNPTASASVSPTDFTIQSLTARGAPDASNDKIPLYDNAAGSIKYVTPAQIASSATAGVSSFAGQTGAITLGIGLGNSGTVINNTGIVSIHKQVFTSSGTYTPTTGMLYAQIECVGGGGGGGGVATAGASQGAIAGSGAAGSYSRTLTTSASIGVSKIVTIGAAGTAGTNTGGNGGTGGSTSLGTLCISPGGGGGGGGSGGAGGITGGTGAGDITTSGNGGKAGAVQNSTVFSVVATQGAASVFGGAAATTSLGAAGATNGAAGTLGAGGNGGISFTAGGAATGGAGGSGIVYITEYCNQ